MHTFVLFFQLSVAGWRQRPSTNKNTAEYQTVISTQYKTEYCVYTPTSTVSRINIHFTLRITDVEDWEGFDSVASIMYCVASQTYTVLKNEGND